MKIGVVMQDGRVEISKEISHIVKDLIVIFQIVLEIQIVTIVDLVLLQQHVNVLLDGLEMRVIFVGNFFL